MLTANLKAFLFFPFFAMFYIKNRITNDPHPRSKYVRASFAQNKDVQSCAIKHKQILFMSSGGKFKLYTVPNGLLFSTPTSSGFHLNA
jgi:hypothetical protein